MTPLGQRAGTALRTVDEGRIIDQVMLWGFAFDVREGQAERARGEAEQALERWLGLGLGHALTAGGGRLYDPVEVMNFFIAAGRRGRTDFGPSATWPPNGGGSSKSMVMPPRGDRRRCPR